MTTYIESTPLSDGTYDHTEVRAAYQNGAEISAEHPGSSIKWPAGNPKWFIDTKYRAQVPDTYGIHESSSTLREVKGDAGPAVAEMLLDRIKELEVELAGLRDTIEDIRCYVESTSSDNPTIDKIRASLDKDME